MNGATDRFAARPAWARLLLPVERLICRRLRRVPVDIWLPLLLGVSEALAEEQARDARAKVAARCGRHNTGAFGLYWAMRNAPKQKRSDAKPIG